jgi:hypothetical protein
MPVSVTETSSHVCSLCEIDEDEEEGEEGEAEGEGIGDTAVSKRDERYERPNKEVPGGAALLPPEESDG